MNHVTINRIQPVSAKGLHTGRGDGPESSQTVKETRTKMLGKEVALKEGVRNVRKIKLSPTQGTWACRWPRGCAGEQEAT